MFLPTKLFVGGTAASCSAFRPRKMFSSTLKVFLRFALLLALVIALESIAVGPTAAQEPVTQLALPKTRIPAKHDPADQPFRRVPMMAASRSIAIALTTNLHLAFDTKLLRAHTAWTGPSVSLYGPPYTGYKEPFIGQIEGKILWTFPPYFPWSTHEPSEAALTNL